MIGFWIILTAALVALLNATVGSFLLVRHKSMMGDAISHAVLPGIVIAFLIGGNRDSIPVLLGAAAAGMLVTFMIEFLNKKVKLQKDASMGISYTFFFAVGIILITSFASDGDVDLDAECVLYGEIALVTLDKVSILGFSIPKQTLIMLFSTVVVFVIIRAIFNKLLLTSFDEEYASSLGINTTLWRYILMAIVSVSTVVSFESVGAVLVIAFMIGPVATAFLITQNIIKMIGASWLFGIAAAILGYFLADWINGSIAGAMATTIGVQFAMVFIITLFKKRRNIGLETS